MEPELRILIIDDDEVDHMIIVRSLKKAGIAAKTNWANSIGAAWSYVRENQYDCVFLDYRLPGGDGLELLQEFRKAGYTMPIIVVTSQGDEKIAVDVMKSGGTDYFSKQLLNPEGISQVLRNAIRTHHAEEERRRTSQALEKSQLRLAEAQRIANVGNWEIDLATGKRYWSDEVYRILGYENVRSQPDTATFSRHIHSDFIEVAENLYERCVKEGHHFKLDMQVVREDMEIRDVEVQCRPVRNDAGRTIAVVGTLQDISARKTIEQELIEARDLAQRSARAKEEFLANMSHEIRTPMNAILGFTKLLNDTPLNEEQRDFLQAIDTSGEALIAIINDILDLSKIEAGMLTFENVDFRLADLLNSLVRIFRARAQEKKLALNISIGPGVPEFIRGDQVRLNQVLLNLVGNAIKFTEEGGVDIEIKLLAEKDGVFHLVFEVSDTGIGIPREHQKRIFESFTQASNETTRKFGGTGLGLTICKRIVELQKGRIGVSSTPGEGSTFFFDIKFQAGKAPSVDSAPPATERFGPAPKEKLRVLLAEDNRMNQKLASKILEGCGFFHEIAENGRIAVEKVMHGNFHVVLMDIQMPEMDGYEATRRIRALEDGHKRSIPIIALTAHAMQGEREKVRQAGMDAFLSKPFNPKVLREMIESLAGRPLEAIAPSADSDSDSDSDIISDAPSGYRYIQMGQLTDLSDGSREFEGELMDIFLEEAPKAIAAMRKAVEDNDLRALYLAEHGIKPSFLLFDVLGAGRMFPDLENLIKSEAPVDQLKAIVEEISKAWEGAEEEIRRERALVRAGA